MSSRWETTAARDTARATLGLFPRRITGAVATWLLALSALAWALTVRQARSMSAMVSGLGQVGRATASDTAAPVFLAMWVGMMVAMMFPTVIPMVLAHRLVVRRRGEGDRPTVAFVVGYLAVWSAIGLVPLAAFLAFRHLSGEAGQSRWLPTLAGAILVVAGLYQFSGWKAACLRTCRSPLAFVAQHDFGTGSPGALRAGASHGAWCLGCCWALMSVLVLVGFMNLVWMAGLSLVFLAEKSWRRGVAVSHIVGGCLLALGLAVVAYPSLLPALSSIPGAHTGTM